MISLRLYEYLRILNPAVLTSNNKVLYDQNGEVSLQYGIHQIRTYEQYPEPFPLYPGELLLEKQSLVVVNKDSAIKYF